MSKGIGIRIKLQITPFQGDLLARKKGIPQSINQSMNRWPTYCTVDRGVIIVQRFRTGVRTAAAAAISLKTSLEKSDSSVVGTQIGRSLLEGAG